MNYDCFEQEVSYIQGDIIVGGGFDLRVPTHHHCQRECQAHEECKHFTYYSRKFEKNDELIRSCWLLKEALEAFPDPEARGVISGPDFCPEDTEEIHDSDPDQIQCLRSALESPRFWLWLAILSTLESNPKSLI